MRHVNKFTGSFGSCPVKVVATLTASDNCIPDDLTGSRYIPSTGVSFEIELKPLQEIENLGRNRRDFGARADGSFFLSWFMTDHSCATASHRCLC